MSFNLEDIDIPVEFRFDLFQKNKDYTLFFFDILHPEEKSVSKYKDGRECQYLVWRVLCSENYVEDGIPLNTEYFQQFSKKSFSIAYAKYRYYNSDFAKYVYAHKNDIMNAQVTFHRVSKKKMIIKNIVLLPSQSVNEYSKDL